MKKLTKILIMVVVLLNVTSMMVNSEDLRTPSGIPINELESIVDEFAKTNLSSSSPGASVIIFKNGQIVFSKGYGYADVENRVEVNVDETVFEIGSITKLYTWVAIMQLVDSGDIDLDASVAEYLPDSFNNQVTFQQDFTLRDMMNHSAGFGEYIFDVIAFDIDDITTLEEALLGQRPIQYYDVGSASAYSNYTSALAGLVIEEVTGMSYDEYIQTEIFDRLSMKHSAVDSTLSNHKVMRANKAHGYVSDGQGDFYKNKWSYISLAPAGSINSIATDLAKFAMAIVDRQHPPLFENESTSLQMMSPSYDIGSSFVGTAHGFFEYDGNSYTIGHGGNTAAFSSQLTLVPEEQFGMVVLTNVKQEMSFMFGLQKMLMGGTSQIETNELATSLPSSEHVEGGKYVPYQRNVGYMLDFFRYLGLYQVSSPRENEIVMSVGSVQANYLQIAPYKYKLIEANHILMDYGYDELSFVVKDGRVEGISVGHGLDLSILPNDRAEWVLIASAIAVIILVLFNALGLIRFVIEFMRKKTREGGRKAR